MRAVVARLIEIRVTHIEEAAERRAHVRPAAPEAVISLLGTQVPAGHEVGHQFRIPRPRAAQPGGELHDVRPLMGHDRRDRPRIVERHRVRFVQLLGQQPHAEQNRSERARAADDVDVQGNRVGGVRVVQKGERRRMPHRGHQRLIFRTEALVEERVAGGGEGTDLGAEALGRIAAEGTAGQGDGGGSVRTGEVLGAVHADGWAGQRMSGGGTVHAGDGDECAEGAEEPAAVKGRKCGTLASHAMPCLPVGEAHVSESDCMFTQTAMTALRLLAIRSAEWNSPA